MLLVFRLLLLPGYLFLQYKLVLLIRSKCCYFSMFCCCVFPCSLELKLSCPSRKQQRSSLERAEAHAVDRDVESKT